MKLLFTGILVAIALFASAQRQQIKFKPLEDVENGTVIKPNETIIYGGFLRKPGIWYDYLQSALIWNTDTREMFSVLFDENIKGGNERGFCYHIKPGNYQIVFLIYKKAKWYGDLQTRTPVFKNIDYNVNVKAKLDSGLIKKEDLHYFSFKIEKEGLYYLGQWHFETGVVFFSDDKATLDKKLSANYYFLKFNEAQTLIPN